MCVQMHILNVWVCMRHKHVFATSALVQAMLNSMENLALHPSCTSVSRDAAVRNNTLSEIRRPQACQSESNPSPWNLAPHRNRVRMYVRVCEYTM
jgi:hypothetical protein